MLNCLCLTSRCKYPQRFQPRHSCGPLAVPTAFDQRILAFDAEAARHYAGLAVKATVAGKGFPVPDGYIAAIAAARGFQVASRDTAPFRAAGLPVINPWEHAS